MALKIRTVMTYPLNGSTVDFGITFEYLARKFVSVTLIGKDRKELVLNQDFRFTTKTQITTTRAWSPSDGYTMIEIRRFTSATDRLVDFSDGSILRAYDLNIAQVQTLHVAEEARDLTADTIGVNNDGDLDARGRRIVNLANAVDDDDAISLGQVKGWNESAWNSKIEAASSADWSKRWAAGDGVIADGRYSSKQYNEWAMAIQADVERMRKLVAADAAWADESVNKAKLSETQAASSASSAAADARLANESKVAAKASEVAAKASEDRAILEANKLENNNAIAAAIESVSGNDVVWKGIHRFSNATAIRRSENTSHVWRQGLWAEGNALHSDLVMELPGGQVGGGAFTHMHFVYPVSGVPTLDIYPHTTLNNRVITKDMIDSQASFAAGHADQYTAYAPLWQQIRESGGYEYFPLIKQRSYQAGRDARAWTMGTLVDGNRIAQWNLVTTDESGYVGATYLWTHDGDFNAPRQVVSGSFRTHGGSVLGGDGNIIGSAFGPQNNIADWIRANFPGDIWLANPEWFPHNGSYQELTVGSGHVCTGIVLNTGGVCTGMQHRGMWIGYHNGTRRQVASNG